MIDFSGLVSQLLSTYWWLLPLLIVAALFKSSWFKGFICEVKINIAVRLFLNKNGHNLMKCQIVKPGTFPLKGSRQGLWSITVNKNWRVTFSFEHGDVYIVDYEDYH